MLAPSSFGQREPGGVAFEPAADRLGFPRFQHPERRGFRPPRQRPQRVAIEVDLASREVELRPEPGQRIADGLARSPSAPTAFVSDSANRTLTICGWHAAVPDASDVALRCTRSTGDAHWARVIAGTSHGPR